ncbi:OmpA family protein [Arhodomonas sp. SL1]|uniref:OmpA family protein n=1 Tax=Arhodomonas sp. SL1 TaxID=3425691 RepID=UPI003F883E9B
MKQTTAKNTLLPIGMGLVLSLGLVATASADQHMEGGQGEYWTNNDGEAWMSTSGECWFNPAMEKTQKREECGDVIETAEAEPEPEMVERTERVSLDAETLFGFDEATLTDDGMARLDRMANRIERDWEINRIRVIGHTDRIGPEEYNQGLSERRAQAVADYLQSKPALSGYDMQVMGMGESEPVVQCENTGGRDQLIDCLQPNRRVEVEINGMKTVVEQK